MFKEREVTREIEVHLARLLMSRARRENLGGLVLLVCQESRVTWEWMDCLVCVLVG